MIERESIIKRFFCLIDIFFILFIYFKKKKINKIRESKLKCIYFSKKYELTNKKVSYDYRMKEDKDKIVSWAVSNCKTSSQREDYIKELSKFININQVKYLHLTITQIFKIFFGWGKVPGINIS